MSAVNVKAINTDGCAAGNRPVAADGPGSLAELFSPRSVAVLGASANPERFSGKIVPTLLRQGFGGAIYPINPARTHIAGLPCYGRLLDVPGDVDCVVFALAAEHIEAAIAQCAQKCVKLLVVCSAGFAEQGDDGGVALQENMLRLASKAGIRVLGPNCIGFANLVARVCISSAAAMSWPDIPQGRIGLVSQSGGLGLASILHAALEAGIAFSHIVTTGNEADLNTMEIARFLVSDEHTDVLAMTVEAVRDIDGFIGVLRAARQARKPVVILKSGRTELGKVMAASHTGALAGSVEVFEAACRQYAAVCANDIDDFYELASMLGKLRHSGKLAQDWQPGKHCAAVSISGGHIGLFADHGSLAGLSFPEFSTETLAAVARELGFEGNFQNPLDTTARTIGDDGFWGRCVEVLLADPSIHVVVPIITVARSYEPAVRDFIDIARRSKKIVIVLWAGGDFEGEAKRLLAQSDIPVFRTPARTAEALRVLDSYYSSMSTQHAEHESTCIDEARSRLAAQALQNFASVSKASLSESQSRLVLGELGFPFTGQQLAGSMDEALAAAGSLGYPLVLKADHPDIPHKTDVGAVFLNIRDEAALRDAYGRLEQRMREIAPGKGKVLVQPMVDVGTELIVGVHRDVEFGPVVLLGIGGVFVEVLQDVAIRKAPIGREDALSMMAELRASRLLDGVRGQRPVDKEELAQLLVMLSEFAHANAEILKEVDINPLALDKRSGRLVALDALIVLDDAAGRKDQSGPGRAAQGSMYGS
nr:acetate--CoA ligase family protein [Candidimonas humi]